MLKTAFNTAEKKKIEIKAATAKKLLLNNIRQFEQFSTPVLLAGEVYSGIWLEHNQDNIFLAEYAPEAAWASQQIFMNFQRKDGLLPFMFQLDRSGWFGPDILYWHIQTVYPFVRCAVDIADRVGKDDKSYEQIYRTGCRYDLWMERYRNRAGTGLVEMYCEWDTGHDNSPRVTTDGIPHGCPDHDANHMPDIPVMPVLSVDLSAMRYGGQIALAELAKRLGKIGESVAWYDKAAALKAKIQELCYDQETDFYYDRDQRGLRKYRTEHITRLFLNRFFDQKEFNRIYQRYFTTENEFWTPYPFPSVSVSDPSFVRDCPKNSWGGCSQALTALRAIFWMTDYGRTAELEELMRRYLDAHLRYDNHFPQEINPFTGAPVGEGSGYTPALIFFIESAKRAGV